MHNPLKILIAEDDQLLNQQITELVRNAGYQVETCFDGDSALLAASKHQHQLMLLDVMMPGKNGFSVLSMLRKTSQIPVIMVTAKGAEEERITGLRKGADDYIAKPFNTTELLLRIEALLRRTAPNDTSADETVIQVDELILNKSKQNVTYATMVTELTAIQFQILWQLAAHRGEVLSKSYLSQQALNRAHGTYDRGLDMHVSRIRRKLNQINWKGERLQTVHGEGYCLR